MKIYSVFESLEKLEEKLKENKPLFFSRFGDGDLKLINKESDILHKYNHFLSEELRESFCINKPNFLKACTGNYPLEEKMEPKVFAPFIKSSYYEDLVKQINPKQEEYYNPVMFHYLYCFHRDILNKFILNYILGKRILYIGSIDKSKLENLFGKIKIQITCPSKNSYEGFENTWSNVKSFLPMVDVVLPCMGLPSRVLNKRLFEYGFKGASIDFGSIVDFEAGLETRSWIKILKNRRI